MILWRNIENYHFLSFSFRPQISPIFTMYMLGANLGSLLYGDVSVMRIFSENRAHTEPRHEKTGFLHKRKQRRRSASR